jgi:hypothetical protein
VLSRSAAFRRLLSAQNLCDCPQANTNSAGADITRAGAAW